MERLWANDEAVTKPCPLAWHDHSFMARGPDGEKIPCPTCHGDARVPLTTDELWAALAEVTNDDMDVCLGPSGIAISLNGSDFSEWLPTLTDALRAALSRFRLDGDAHAVE